jgi:hypothetical protein
MRNGSCARLYVRLLSDPRHRVGVVPSHEWNARVNEFNSSKPSKNATSPASRLVFARRRRADWRRTSLGQMAYVRKALGYPALVG